MTIPNYRHPALIGTDGTLYQNPDFFVKESTTLIKDGIYWRSTGVFSVFADANRGFFKHTDFMNSEGMGSTSLFGPINGPVVDGSAVRLANVADPEDATKRCWLYRININDPDTAGSGNKRAELSADDPSGWLLDKDRGHSMWFATRYCDLSGTTTGRQVISQVHASNTNVGCPPWYAVFVAPNNRIYIYLRHDPNEVTSDATNVNEIVYDNFFEPFVWYYWYVEYRQDHNGGTGYCRIWLRKKGDPVPTTPIVNYTGNLGYVDNGKGSYLKNGIYHFTDAFPQFAYDPALPTRECWQKGPYQITAGVVTKDEAFAFLASI